MSTQTNQKIAIEALQKNMGLQPNESLLIVADEKMQRESQWWYEAGKTISSKVVITLFEGMTQNAQEPPIEIAKAMTEYDVVMLQTSYSLSHTKARFEGCAKGARMASLPTTSLEVLTRTLVADYEEIKNLSLKMASLLTKAREITITSPNGTNLSMRVEGRHGEPDTGYYTNPGDFGNLPAGESYIAPLEGTANGTYVADGSFANLKLDQPISITVKNGYATRIGGGQPALNLEKQLKAVGQKARNIAELGIGTNRQANPKGKLIEAEKAYGTVHIALGDNSTFGGTVSVPFHSDGVILSPTLIFDGVVIIKDGEFIL